MDGLDVVGEDAVVDVDVCGGCEGEEGVVGGWVDVGCCGGGGWVVVVEGQGSGQWTELPSHECSRLGV